MWNIVFFPVFSFLGFFRDPSTKYRLVARLGATLFGKNIHVTTYKTTALFFIPMFETDHVTKCVVTCMYVMLPLIDCSDLQATVSTK